MTNSSVVNIPNALSALRLALAPVLVVVAFAGLQPVFVALLALSLLTDLLDGKIARALGQSSELGARLDSWADFLTYTTVPICAYYLRPEILFDAPWIFWSIVIAYIAPLVIGFVKFRALTSYHTRGAVISAYALGISSLIFFAGGPTWPLAFAAAVLVAAELEEIAITFTLPTLRSNVRSLADARAHAAGLR